MHQKVVETEAAIQAAFIALLQTKAFEKKSLSATSPSLHISIGALFISITLISTPCLTIMKII